MTTNTRNKTKTACYALRFWQYPLRVLLTLTVLFFLIPTANAASFDCRETAITTSIEKLICSSEKISPQDANMAFIYKYALLYAKNSNHVKSTQRAWLKQRNQCMDEICLKTSYQSRINVLLTTIDNSNQPSVANDLKGLWYGGERASKAVYGTILITDRYIMWGARDTKLKQDPKLLENRCKTTYSIETEPLGTHIDNGLNRMLILDEKSQFKTYKIKPAPNKCYPDFTYMRFNFFLETPLYTADHIYADVIEYEKNGQANGGGHFYKFN